MPRYATIQQHKNLRIPDNWNTQERAMIIQLEEVLDDIYRRFGRLRMEDLGKDLQDKINGMDARITELEGGS